MNLSRAALLFVIGASLAATVALACDCGRAPPTIAAILATDGGVVFEGTPARQLSAAPSDGGAPRELTFAVRVTRAWRGVQLNEEVPVTTSLSNCGLRLKGGERLLIAAPSAQGLRVGECTGTYASQGRQREADTATLGGAKPSKR